MKWISCLNPLGVGAIALSTALLLQQPGDAKPKVTVTTTPSPSDSGATVVPIVPTAPTGVVPPVAPMPSGVICIPDAPCAQPIPKPEPIAKDYFFCGKDPHGRPTTYVNTATGNLPLIRWRSYYFEPSGYSPTVRCQDVSQRFNRFYNQGILNFITTGVINNQPTICVAGTKGGPCSGLLFTLKPGQNATRTIQQLFDVREGISPPLFESGERIYVDMRPYIDAIRANR